MTALMLAFAAASHTFNLPEGLLSAVCFVESSHRIHVVRHKDGHTPKTSTTSHGVCQMKLETAQLMGFKGTSKQLMNPRVNTYYAAKYLNHQIDRYDGDVAMGIAAYNMGKCRLGDDLRPINHTYVNKVYKAWQEGR